MATAFYWDERCFWHHGGNYVLTMPAGEQVSAEPEYADERLTRFKYTFPDGAEYALTLRPIRKNYMRRLLQEAGFQRVRNYGDFQETFAED